MGTGYRGELVALRARKEALEAELEEVREDQRLELDDAEDTIKRLKRRARKLERKRARAESRDGDLQEYHFNDHVDAIQPRPVKVSRLTGLTTRAFFILVAGAVIYAAVGVLKASL